MEPTSQGYFQTSPQRLFFQEWGAKENPAVVFIHGFPGCADQAKLMCLSSVFNQMRLIALDRPGYGKSDAQPSLTPLSFAKQVTAYLDKQGVDKVRILSVSGGAPYAYALAYHLGPRAKKMCSIGGIGPMNIDTFRLMNVKQKKAWMMRNLVPVQVLEFFLDRILQSGINQIDELLFANMETYSEPDQKVFSHEEIAPVLSQTLKNALAGGPGGILLDMKVYSRSWGFPLKKIEIPVTLWHGSKDDVVHLRIAKNMRKQLSNCQLHVAIGEGHYSLPMNMRDGILQDILDL